MTTPDTIENARRKRIQAIRAAIASGTYETPEKIDRAVDGLILALLDDSPAPFPVDRVTPDGWDSIDPAGD